MSRTVSTIAALCFACLFATHSGQATSVNDDTAEKVAYCLGKADQWKHEKDWMFSLPVTPPEYPDANAADEAKYRSETILLRNYLANRHYTNAQNTPPEVAHAYNQGAQEVITCLKDDLGPDSCNAGCAKLPNTSECSLKCPLPASCKRPDPCPDLERTLNP